MIGKLVAAVVCGLMIMLFIAYIPNIIPHYYNFKSLDNYVVIMAYSQQQCETISKNTTAQEMLKNWTVLAKNMGFKGVGLAEYECYWLDGYLKNYLDLLYNESFDVAVYYMWRDFTVNVNFSLNAPRPIDWRFWSPQGFPDNITQVNAWLNVLGNFTKATRNYPNVKYYLLYMPFRWYNATGVLQANLTSPNYKKAIQAAVDRIRSVDSLTPILLASDGIELEIPEAKNYLPYDVKGIQGYAFTYYSRTYDNFFPNRLKEYVDFYKSIAFKYGHDKLFLAEWGWETTAKIYGQCSSETRKSSLLKETFKTISDCGIKSDAYFCIQDFPSENADWGLAYYNYTLKPSGKVMMNMLNSEGFYEFKHYPLNINKAFPIGAIFIVLAVLFIVIREFLK